MSVPVEQPSFSGTRAGRRKVAVIGAGLSGLSCAYELASTSDVSVFYAQPPERSTSAAAIAIWHVYLVDPDDTTVLAWSATTLARLQRIAAEVPEAGVYVVRGVDVFRGGVPRVPPWAHLVSHFRMLDTAELAAYPGVVWAYAMDTMQGEMARYLPWLRAQARARGVRFVEHHVGALDELPPESFDTLVNCAGLGARELASDGSLVGVRGQYLVVRPPTPPPTSFVEDDEHPAGIAQTFPRGDGVCVGGTAEFGVEALTFTEDASALLRRAADTAPWLRTLDPRADVLGRVVGIRPYRPTGVRLEREQLPDGRWVIHNYGHGGAGFSLSWGCAEQVAALAASG